MTAPVFSDRVEHRGPCFRCRATWLACESLTEGRCCEDCLEQYGATHPRIDRGGIRD